jgi:hypothetical protein
MVYTDKKSSCKLYFGGAVLGLIILALVYYLFDPSKYSFFPKCPFHWLTGLDCPGCGSQRAVFSLLHGHFYQAMKYNLLLVIALPFLAIHLGYRLTGLVKNKDIRWKVVYHPITSKVIFVIVVVFTVIRNLPAYRF